MSPLKLSVAHTPRETSGTPCLEFMTSSRKRREKMWGRHRFRNQGHEEDPAKAAEKDLSVGGKIEKREMS